ncbi:hypothetical protein DPMN_168673 [Dreissena polymorpha]|uniref:Uncharacterized protein n=1 Tax=Dreissena polymorpha TaxID=45954 RepID=A0A9D4F340_DREPO|nr:hypothetical protein DPMN_168673 [Dreissena polymorpha]
MMYRIINNLVDSNARSVLIPAGVHTRGHANCYIVPLTTVNAYQLTFFPTGIRLWNALPEQVDTFTSIDVFKAMMGELYN